MRDSVAAYQLLSGQLKHVLIGVGIVAIAAALGLIFYS